MTKVLIVDDERSIRRTLGEFLRLAGYDVAEAEDAEVAMKLLHSAAFDVVVTDIVLPRVSGVELLRQIHASAPHVKVVMMTGEPTVETAAEAVRLGATDYLAKPVNKAAILKVVAQAAHIKELEDTRRRLEAENQAHREDLERMVSERTAQLQSSEERFRGLVEAAFDWIWELDAEGRYTYASPRVIELLGYQPADVIGRTPFDFMPEAESQRVKAIFAHIAAQREPFANLEKIHRHRNGREVLIECAGVPILSPAGNLLGYRGIDRDVTARKAAEDQMRKLARAVEQSPAVIIITDRTGRIEFVNPKFTEVTGYPAEEVLGWNPRILKSGETPQDAYRHLWETIVAGREWRGELHNKRKDGSLYWETKSISGIRDATGQITHFISLGEDVTEKKLLEAKFLRAQRVESIGSLTSGIAHDLNNILSPILMCTELLNHRDARLPAHEANDLIKMIETCTRRASDVVGQLLIFGRGQEGGKQPIQLRHLITDMVKIVRETFPRNIEVTTAWPKQLPLVRANITQIHQVLLNLCVNARDAMPDGGKLSLVAESLELTAQDLAASGKSLVPGPYVRLQVIDTGVGIPKESRSRIFDAFFTTKGEGQGTGLGLTTVLSIVTDHDGLLSFTSEVGRGTTFEILLPATKMPVTKPEIGEPEAVAPAGRGELILVVDDEVVQRSAACAALEHHGYRTLQAHDGIDALAQFAKHPGEIVAMVTDYMMPRMDGVALCLVVRELSPATRIIVSSGGLFGKNGEQAMQSFKNARVNRYLHKPHRTDVLLQALAAELQGVGQPGNDTAGARA